MSAAVRGIWGAAVIAACAAPSAAANVWPRVSRMIAEGAASGTEAGITAALVMSALLMAATPFAMKKAPNVGFWAVCLIFGVGLATFNYTMAVDLAGKWRDQSTAPAALTAAKAKALKSRIAGATAAMDRLAKLPHTTAAQVTAADDAVALATEARDQECGKVGRNCRARVAELKAVTETRAILLANRAVSEKRELYEAAIAKAQKELDALGVIPNQIDPAAARIGKAFDKLPFIDLGPRPDLVVIEWWPTWVAIIIEVIALLGPRIVLTATMPRDFEAPANKMDRERFQNSGFVEVVRAPSSEKPPTALPTAAPIETPATATTPKNPKKIKRAAVGDCSSVREWHRSRTTARPGSKLKPKDTYDTAYLPWCQENGIEPVSLTKFGLTMKAAPESGGCGVQYSERNKRGFYTGIALTAIPRLVTADASPR